MNYIELSVPDLKGLDAGILVAFLGELDFESFQETENGLLAYCREQEFRESAVRELFATLPVPDPPPFTFRHVPRENWNAVWEENYESVTVNGLCHIRAPFHPPAGNFPYELVIEPKMSFGTAHHATTRLMVSMLLKEELIGRTLLDMGCGTAVLAILASMMGATRIVAIDNDDWAFRNAIENRERNHQSSVEVILGDASQIPEETFDLIVANINRNVLVDDIPSYADHLNGDGVLLMSGFYEEDLPAIHEAATSCGLNLIGFSVEQSWVGIKYAK